MDSHYRPCFFGLKFASIICKELIKYCNFLPSQWTTINGYPFFDSSLLPTHARNWSNVVIFLPSQWAVVNDYAFFYSSLFLALAKIWWNVFNFLYLPNEWTTINNHTFLDSSLFPIYMLGIDQMLLFFSLPSTQPLMTTYLWLLSIYIFNQNWSNMTAIFWVFIMDSY